MITVEEWTDFKQRIGVFYTPNNSFKKEVDFVTYEFERVEEGVIVHATPNSNCWIPSYSTLYTNYQNLLKAIL